MGQHHSQKPSCSRRGGRARPKVRFDLYLASKTTSGTSCPLQVTPVWSGFDGRIWSDWSKLEWDAAPSFPVATRSITRTYLQANHRPNFHLGIATQVPQAMYRCTLAAVAFTFLVLPLDTPLCSSIRCTAIAVFKWIWTPKRLSDGYGRPCRW